jgi:hypothetical protein
MTPPPAAAAVPAVHPRRVARPERGAPAAPRRVSGPAKGRTAVHAPTHAAPRGGAAALPAPGGLALGLVDALTGVSRHRWLDRLIHGRGWIALIAFALIGIVAMQLWVVKLGVGIGRALEHESLLARENATLSIEDAKLSSGERVERIAAAQGMVVAPPGALRFETVRRGVDARLAAAALARGMQAQETSASSSASPSSTSGSEAAAGPGSATPETVSETAPGQGESTASGAGGESAPAAAGAAGTTGSAMESSTAATATSTATPGASAPGADTAPAASGGAAAVGESPGTGAGSVSGDGGTPQATPGG